MDLYDALRIIGVVSDTFWRPITPNTNFVAQNSRRNAPSWMSRRSRLFISPNLAAE